MSEESVIEGGPEHDSPATAAELGTGSASPDPTSSPGATAPGMQEVEINGQKFAVSEAMAAAFSAHNETAAVRVSDLQSGLEAARAAVVAPPESKPAGVDPAQSLNLGTYNWETKLFENPAEAMREVVNIAKNEAKDELRKEYLAERAQETAREDFWTGFYKKNDHLKDRRDVVDFIVNRDADLAKMSLEKAGQEIKDRANAFLKDAGVSIPSGGNPPIVEGGPEKAPKTETAPIPKETRGKSMGDVLRDRSAQRAEARHTNMKVVKS